MTVLHGARVFVTGGAGTIGSTIVDQLLDAGAEHVDVLDNLVRGRRDNLSAALDSGRVRLVEGDLRDRDLVHDLTSASDVVFHQAAIRITQCAEEPRLALEVLVDGTFNVVEAAAEHKVAKLVLASSASVYGLAEAFPTDERHHHHNNDTFYGAAKSFNEGMARSFRATHGLDYVALRYFNVYGPRMDVHGLYTEVLVRWMERIADGLPPLIFGDGSQTMDFVYTVDIARSNVLAALSDVREGVYNIASGRRPHSSGWLRPCLRAMDSDMGVEPRTGPGRERRDRRRLADVRAAERDLGWSATTDLDTGLRELVDWWRPQRDVIAAGRKVSAMTRINVMQPWLGEEEVAAVTDVIRSGWVAQGPRVAAFEQAFAARMQSSHAVAVSSCTTALHLALVVAAVGPGDDVVVPSFSFIATANAAHYVGARPVFADVDPITGNVTADTVKSALTPTTKAVIAVDQGGVPVDLHVPSAICAIRWGSLSSRTPPAAPARRTPAAPSAPDADIVAWSFHPRKIVTTGEGGMITTSRKDWADRARLLREHAMSVSAAERHERVLAPAESYVEVGLQLSDDRPAGSHGYRPARSAGRGGRPATGTRVALPRGTGRASVESAAWRTPRTARRTSSRSGSRSVLTTR